MTETVSHIALKKLNSDPAYFALGEVGFEQDERGCLIIDAPHLQARRFVTNDMVRLHGNKRFEWLGRFDYVINSGGIKLFPELIEQKLVRSIPGRFLLLPGRMKCWAKVSCWPWKGHTGTSCLCNYCCKKSGLCWDVSSCPKRL